MSAIRFFTDEDVYGVIAAALRTAGYDARSAPESGRRGEADESQLEWAGNEGRVLVTFNVSHFANLHAACLGAGKHHAGIVTSSQRPANVQSATCCGDCFIWLPAETPNP